MIATNFVSLVQYDGDSARFLFKGSFWRIIGSRDTTGPGQMEVGLSYLSEENSGLILTMMDPQLFAAVL